MYCPSCGSEYREGIERCADCGGPLTPGERPPPAAVELAEPPAEAVTVYTSRNPARLPIARSLLAAEAVPFFVRGEALQDLFGLGQMGHGFNPIVGPVEIQVPQEKAERARELLADLDPEVAGAADGQEGAEGHEGGEVAHPPAAAPPPPPEIVLTADTRLPAPRDRRRFRALVLAYLAVTLVRWTYYPRWWRDLPASLWSALESHFDVGELGRTLDSLGWLELPAAVAIAGGLLTSLRPAHHLFLALWAWVAVGYVFRGPGIAYGVSTTLALLSGLLGGAILALVYFGPIGPAFAPAPRRADPAPTSPE